MAQFPRLERRRRKPPSAVVNIVYALHYPVQPRSTLSTDAKAGIGTGVFVADISIITLFILIWRTRRHKQVKAALSAIRTNGEDSSGREQSAILSMSPYYSSRNELPSNETTHPVPVEAPSYKQVTHFLSPQS